MPFAANFKRRVVEDKYEFYVTLVTRKVEFEKFLQLSYDFSTRFFQFLQEKDYERERKGEKIDICTNTYEKIMPIR